MRTLCYKFNADTLGHSSCIIAFSLHLRVDNIPTGYPGLLAASNLAGHLLYGTDGTQHRNAHTGIPSAHHLCSRVVMALAVSGITRSLVEPHSEGNLCLVLAIRVGRQSGVPLPQQLTEKAYSGTRGDKKEPQWDP